MTRHGKGQQQHGKGQQQQSEHDAAGAHLRRARAWAWTIFWSMAGTSVLYNCYHAFVIAKMPWYTGIPESVVPLLLAIGMLEVAAAWRDNLMMQIVAWSVTAGAMAWSAIAINPVVRLDAPLHWGFLFGVLADTAALGAMYFILNGPTATKAVAAIDRKVAGLITAVETAQSARDEIERSAHAEVSALNVKIGTLQADLASAQESAHRELLSARQDAQRALDQVAALTEQLRTASAPKPAASRPGRRAPAAAQDTLERETNKLRAIMALRDKPNLCAPGKGAELALELGCSKPTGRRLLAQLTENGVLKPEFREPADADAAAQ